VGCDSVESLEQHYLRRRASLGEIRVHTRQLPRRAAELCDQGSLYWVFKGLILCRQPFLRILETAPEDEKRCAFVMDPALIRVAPTPRRPFQGWRYLEPSEAPPDLDAAGTSGGFPQSLAAQLRDLGAW
jgi:hypothetical protein